MAVLPDYAQCKEWEVAGMPNTFFGGMLMGWIMPAGACFGVEMKCQVKFEQESSQTKSAMMTVKGLHQTWQPSLDQVTNKQQSRNEKCRTKLLKPQDQPLGLLNNL